MKIFNIKQANIFIQNGATPIGCCKNHNIKLLRIPYWDFNNIESILSKELNLPTPTNIPDVVTI
ncbi:MAG: hypothetical protein M0Q94_10270 [Candidatus Cloacimonetes bacterium]|nr:hypothetical protein [Candidatus Cloacimonadota bacterium]